MTIVTCAEFMPDQPAFMNPGSGLVQNVRPLTERSYSAMPSLSVASGAINNRCQGAFSMRDQGGNVHLYTGDSSKLYRMSAGDTAPIDVSLGGGYATGNTERWAWTQFGNRVIATNFNNSPQTFVEGSSTLFSNLIATGVTSITARYVTVVKDFVFFGNTTDGTDGTQPQRAWWSSINDPTNFPTLGSNAGVQVQSDAQDLFGDYGWIQGLVGNLGQSHGAVFMERGVWRVNYQGTPTVFRFDIAEGVRGTPAPGSICQLGANAFYLGEDGFYAFDGANSTPIGFQKVDRFFYSDVDPSFLYRVSATVDPISKTIYWAYPGVGSSQGTPNRVLIYNWALNRWAVTQPGDINVEVLLHSWSFGITLEQMDSLYPNIDAPGVPSLDDPSLSGGRSVLSCFDTNHRYSNFAGPPLAPTVDTTEVQINQGQRSLVTQTRPLVDGGSPSVAIGTRDRLIDNVGFDSAVALDDNGWCPQRAEGRYHRARITMPAGSAFTHIEGIEYDATESGIR